MRSAVVVRCAITVVDNAERRYAILIMRIQALLLAAALGAVGAGCASTYYDDPLYGGGYVGHSDPTLVVSSTIGTGVYGGSYGPYDSRGYYGPYYNRGYYRPYYNRGYDGGYYPSRGGYYNRGYGGYYRPTARTYTRGYYGHGVQRHGGYHRGYHGGVAHRHR